MRMYDIIAKKRDGEILSSQEIEFAIDGYTKGLIADYQMSALLMAIYLNGMNEEETANLTQFMANSGDIIDLSSIEGIKVDKHSTGGVGDKTTLVIGPIVAACGVKMAKMSGRGLGHTGGTVDKLESIPALKISLEKEEFLKQVDEIGLCVIGQSGNLAPADKKMYALRDVTATVGCLPLIAASIMSKKLAAGADVILLDVKTGGGAFMKTLDDAIELAAAMVSIGEHNGRQTAAIVTDMDTPLGYAIGNSLEVIEAVNTLKGKGPKDLTEVCVYLSAELLRLAGKGDYKSCETEVLKVIENGKAFRKLREMVEMQSGDLSVIEDTENFTKSAVSKEILAKTDGYITAMNTENIGVAAVLLGAGREKKEDQIDYSAGIILHKKSQDIVKKGDALATFYSSSDEKIIDAEELFLSSIIISETRGKKAPLIMAKVGAGVVQKF